MVLSIDKASTLDLNFSRHEEKTSQNSELDSSNVNVIKMSVDREALEAGKSYLFTLGRAPQQCSDVTSGSDNSLILKSVTEEDERPGLLASAFFKKSKAGGGGPSDTNYIRFLHHLTDNLLVKWESILLESRLYIQLPETSLHQGGRDSLVELLDIAEEQLGCSQVIIMFARERSDVAQLMRNFKFLGFETLPPGHQWLPPATDQFFMAYNI
ncbi:ornithine decarboxylase antizyme 1 [Strongylocentrotus purpuratus]|uniref:Ornithine decarboxylase antizyme n=1 Tax=Strongylocentrotus purpuratus TaxID=7668 RepID=A0A7M6UW80_STRPU|nr:ornithine decarboxylase antizyme 1 [Strongylocentrotus purpuratus]|eukprot:NP_001242990.1 ornithine decarboxylase antizyme 1 [Strongylocentrotus purpuratus]